MHNMGRKNRGKHRWGGWDVTAWGIDVLHHARGGSNPLVVTEVNIGVGTEVRGEW
jgi:hypothetical protein